MKLSLIKQIFNVDKYILAIVPFSLFIPFFFMSFLKHIIVYLTLFIIKAIILESDVNSLKITSTTSSTFISSSSICILLLLLLIVIILLDFGLYKRYRRGIIHYFLLITHCYGIYTISLCAI